MIPPAATAAPEARGRNTDARLFTSADLEALLPHVDLFSLNACAPASALAGANHFGYITAAALMQYAL